MEVRNCKNCGRLYNYIGGAYRLCPDCMKKLEEKFQEVKQYIEDNPRSDMRDISENCDVSTRQIEQWIREERLSFSDDSPIGIACEVCGATIKQEDTVKDASMTWLTGLAACMEVLHRP